MKWNPPQSSREVEVASSLRAASHFYKFLWSIRGELFSDGFEEELTASYKPRGQEPCPPAMLAMVMLLQRYDGKSDADAVEAAENDRRWQLVLGTLDSNTSPFGQGSLVRFRTRMMAYDLDKKLVDRTVELAKKTKGFGWQKLRVALDSSPLAGAGRVEDTINLIGRAMSKVVHAVSLALSMEEDDVIRAARLKVLTTDSIKAALDIDWDDDDAQHAALQELLVQVSRLEAWVVKKARQESTESPLKDALELLRRVVEQDTEPDPPGGGRRIIEGVAPDRIVSLSDLEMRHGRKSRSKRFDGYKRHIAVVDELVVATAVEPANRREHEPTERLIIDAQRHGTIAELDIDRGYLPSPTVVELHEAGVVIHSRAWNSNKTGLYTKEDFRIDLRRQRVTCPNGAIAKILPSKAAFFDKADCGGCPLKKRCTRSPRRSITIHHAEGLLIQLRKRAKTRKGRVELRERTVVEHRLARIGSIQGNRARYCGVRKNELDLNNSSAVANLLEVARRRAA